MQPPSSTTPFGRRPFSLALMASQVAANDRPPETIELTLNGPVSRPLRINAILLRWSAVFGISPCGNRTAPYDVGAKSAGVHAPSFRSHVSMWLGAPERKMRMQFLAVLWRGGLTLLALSSSEAFSTGANPVLDEIECSREPFCRLRELTLQIQRA